MCSFVVCTVPADGLAPSGARPSAGIVTTMYGSLIYMGLALEGFNCSIWSTYHYVCISIPVHLLIIIKIIDCWYFNIHMNTCTMYCVYSVYMADVFTVTVLPKNFHGSSDICLMGFTVKPPI